MKYLKTFNENNERIVGYYYNEDDYDEDVPEDLADMSYKLAEDRGIRISSSHDLLYAFYDTIVKKVVGAIFRGAIGVYSFDIVVDSGYERSGLATKLVKIAIDDYEMHKEGNEDLAMIIDCINPIMSDILEKKFGFKEIGKYIHGRRIMFRKN